MLVSTKSVAVLVAFSGCIGNFGSTNAQSLGSENQSQSSSTVAAGQPCEGNSQSMALACADESTLLVCSYNTWVFLSGCPSGTTCQSNFCVNKDSAVVFPILPSASNGDELIGGLSQDSSAQQASSAAPDIHSGSDNQVLSVTHVTSTTATLLANASDTNNSAEEKSDDNDTDFDSSENVEQTEESDSELSEIDDSIENIGTLDEYEESSSSQSFSNDDWFASLKGSANTLAPSSQRICFTALSGIFLSAAFALAA